jgi:uncharacterized membrane protein HdeD (DUF308 family)
MLSILQAINVLGNQKNVWKMMELQDLASQVVEEVLALATVAALVARETMMIRILAVLMVAQAATQTVTGFQISPVLV